MDLFANISPKPEPAITSSARPTVRTADLWEPVALNETMLRIMDYLFMWPRLTNEELGELVGYHPSHVSKIRNSDIFKERYKQRRKELERLEHSRLVKDRERFAELRDKMIVEHEKFIEIDAAKKVGKEIDFQKLRQTSVSTLLKTATDEVGRIEELMVRDTSNGNGTTIEMGIRTVQTGEEAYQELIARFRRGTK